MSDAAEVPPVSTTAVVVDAPPDSLVVLKEAFPDVDVTVIKAVLHASGGQVQVAFDALLGMSDPDFQPNAGPAAVMAPEDEERRRQVEADENLARQMVAESAYGRAHRERQARRAERSQQQQQQRAEADHSFLDDDLPAIRDNIVQGFNETKTKVNSFISSLRTQYAQHFEAEGESAQSSSQRTGALPEGRTVHRTTPRAAYERDAEQIDLLEDDLQGLKLEDNSGQDPPSQAQPSAGKSGTAQPASSASRGGASGSAAAGDKKSSRWQPLTSTTSATGTTTSKKDDQFDIGDDD